MIIRSDEGQTLETSASLSAHGGNLPLIDQVVWYQILVYHFPTKAARQFLWKLTHLLIRSMSL